MSDVDAQDSPDSGNAPDASDSQQSHSPKTPLLGFDRASSSEAIERRANPAVRSDDAVRAFDRSETGAKAAKSTPKRDKPQSKSDLEDAGFEPAVATDAAEPTSDQPPVQKTEIRDEHDDPVDDDAGHDTDDGQQVADQEPIQIHEDPSRSTKT